MYDEAGLPSPEGGANGTSPQPGAPAAPRPKAGDEPEEEAGARLEPVLVKVARREILDHERKRRVELKCMELQEMMEEQGYSEEEIRQKVGTFRQMLMEKEGVITREGSHPRPPVTVFTHGDEDGESRAFADGYEDEYGWHGGYYDPDSAAHEEHSRLRRRSSSSPSPPPKKRKKKGRRRTRVNSCSPARRGKRKKSGKKHKRDRSVSGSRRKRRHRSGTPKNKHKDKNKLRKNRLSQQKTPAQGKLLQLTKCLRLLHRQRVQITKQVKPEAQDRQTQAWWAVQPQSASLPRLEHTAHRQNGHHGERVRNGKDSRPIHLDGEKVNNKLRSLASSSPSEAQKQISPNVRDAKSHGAPCRSPGGLQAYAQVTEPGKGDERPQRGAQLPSESSGRRVGRHRTQGKNCHSPEHSSDSQTDVQPKAKNTHQKAKGSHSSKRHHRGRGSKRHRSTSPSPARHRHVSGRKKSKSHGSLRQRSSSWSSGHSSSRSNSREHGPSKAKSPHTRQNNSRERDNPHYSDAERARRRSRSYSPIRKRRRDSPSFMEARRITSARKRPIPYYRPSPSSSSSASSYSKSSRSRSHSYASYTSYSRSGSRSRSRSRSRSKSRSGSRSPSQARSYYSHSSYESPGF